MELELNVLRYEVYWFSKQNKIVFELISTKLKQFSLYTLACKGLTILLFIELFHSLICYDFFQLFNIYIKKAAEIYGVPKTRQIYEKAIEALHEDNCREMCLRFAEMETKLGEIDRARAIYAHCSQVCDPRVSFTYSFVLYEFALEN